ncbi:MAG: 3-methyl-2-oxobutanoate dehydrogenase subunit VorB [Oscillospiraceae bacterium]|jgi:2-oxoglutarate ferredoxin oxidoreductase subunit alpha|nr:3-methyl-2-oxobutanoate dehydrogenase subunit VorB [Oscillospiraceae bacterium]
MAKLLMKGNEAIAEAAIRAGCRYFFGYPITPQNHIPEYMSKRMPQVGGTFLQAESEVSAINMVYGASGAGARVMTSSSGPGISLKQEGISYLVGAQLPCVIVNIMRGGPGLGSIQPSQGDYYQATRGGGHGDYRIPVFAPSSVGEAVTLTQKAFDIADKYRSPVIVLGDGMIGQMMEPVDLPDSTEINSVDKPWAAVGWDGARPRAIINSLYIDPSVLEQHNIMLQEKFAQIESAEIDYGAELVDDADLVIVAYGTVARIARSAIRMARAEGIKAGMIRPVTLWPFPSDPIAKAAETTKAFLTVEMSAGQMIDDVRLAVAGRKPVLFYGRTGGMVPAVRDVLHQIRIAAGAVDPRNPIEEAI